MASLPLGPFDDLDRVLPPELRDIVGRTTPIPTIAQRAEKIRREDSRMVRADIGQVSGIRPDVEILYGPPVGLDALRDALAELYRRSFQLERFDLPEITGKNVAVTTGAAEALTVLFRCFGETKNVRLGMKMTRAECGDLLVASLKRHEYGMRQCLRRPDDLSDKTYAAFLSFTYNVGVGAFCRSTLARKANAGDLRGACNELPKWVRAGGIKLRGLVNRRADERRLCLEGLAG